MKKTTKCISLTILLVFSGISCTYNSPQMESSIEYRVNASSDMIVNIGYRNAAGQMVTLFTPDNALEWNKKFAVERPFSANLQAGFYNVGASTESCAIEIYVDGALVETYPGYLPASQSYTLFAHYDIPR